MTPASPVPSTARASASPDPSTASAAPTALPTSAPPDPSTAADAVPREAAVAAVPAVPTAVPAPQGVAGGRQRIDAIDEELIELIRRRVSVSAEIQSARLSGGGRRLDLRRETEVIGRYTQAIGRPGTAVAMALLELGRGRV